MVIQGIPSLRKLENGDISNIDIRAEIIGKCGGSAVTLPIKNPRSKSRFVPDIVVQVSGGAVTKMDDVKVGQLVRSRAGRDKGNYYLIYDVLDEAFVRVIDGEKRNLTNPKKKNIRHLEVFSEVNASLVEKLRNGEQITGEEVVRVLKNLG